MTNPLERVTFLLHTRNRPELLLRALDHFARLPGAADLRLMVLDGSDEQHRARLSAGLDQRRFAFPLPIRHHPPSVSFRDRIAEALAEVDTPYVVPAADDDFYFADWLVEAVQTLDRDTTIGTIFGHVLRFRLPDAAPYATTAEFMIVATENPPHPWLEDCSVADRLTAMGASPMGIAVIGWYAMQRTEHLRRTVALMRAHDIDTLFELFFTFAQVALGRSRLIDQVHIARQVDPRERRALLSGVENREEIVRLKRASAELLADLPDVAADEVEALFASSYSAALALMNLTDRKRHLRWLADRLGWLRPLWRRLRDGREAAAAVRPDPRLCRAPQLADCAKEMAIVRRSIMPL